MRRHGPAIALTAMRRALVTVAITVASLVTACASPGNAKLASTQLTEILSELRAATGSFRTAYVAEIERTRTELARAVVARSVKNRIQELSQHFTDPEWQHRFRHQGLIAVSEEIEREQDTARRLVDAADAVRLRQDEPASEGLARLFATQAEALRASAGVLQAEGRGSVASELLARADTLVAERDEALRDDLLRAYLVAYLELGALRREAPRNLRQLTTLIEVLRETHATVHQWVMTDATISGEAVAALLLQHAATLDLETPSDSGGVP